VDTFKEVQRIIAANVGVSPASIHTESKASDLPDWDSLHHLLIVMDIEQTFGFKFAMEEIAGLDSVGKIVRTVEKKVAP
jgi:acyl carrier protein